MASTADNISTEHPGTTENSMTTTHGDTDESSSQEIMESDNKRTLNNNLPLQHLREIYDMEIALKERIIEDQGKLLQLLNIKMQRLLNDKQTQQEHERMEQQSTHNEDNNSNSDTLLQRTTNDNMIQLNPRKYDNFIEQQLIKDKITNIRKFSGNKYDDVDEWLQNIDHDFSSTLVSEEVKLKIIPRSLTNDAKNWFEQNKHRLSTWVIFKKEIQHRFQSSLHKDERFIRLRERKQQTKETGQQFIDAMEKLCFQVNSSMKEEEKMLHIKAGLKPSLKEKVLDKQPQSMDQLRNTIKMVEDIETMLNHGNNNEDQLQQTLFASDVDQPVYDDGNCYALPSHYNNNNSYQYRRQNNYNYRHQQQRQMNQSTYGTNRNYQSRNRYEQNSNQQQSNNKPFTNSSSTTTSQYNNSKKY
ncbi:unnamed protein product [Adineta steineri]|uniref:Retrotransposon gag domain-containing protein n=1 Tax=Adineta steineri TaxID=433720 RepID=A0A818VH09_9BILA|nr:unnamed protein product [Adineta steineri]CAF3712458.1 unnamed protein product [Adineta steineri]